MTGKIDLFLKYNLNAKMEISGDKFIDYFDVFFFIEKYMLKIKLKGIFFVTNLLKATRKH